MLKKVGEQKIHNLLSESLKKKISLQKRRMSKHFHPNFVDVSKKISAEYHHK